MNNPEDRQTTPTASIIVPVYNAETVVRRCIDSILKQNFSDFELILVDDGSKDASSAILDAYAEQDARIRVVHKENTGVSDTRNLAVSMARGKYLQFVDADDWLAPEATGLLVSTAEAYNCDLVVSDFYRVVDNRIAHKGDIQEDGLLSRKEFAACMMEKPADFYYGVLWNKLYRKSLIDLHHIQMNAEISWCEDFMFNLEYLCHAHQIYVLRVPLYYYVRTKQSLSLQGMNLARSLRTKSTVFEYYNRFYKEVFDERDYEKSRLQVYRFFLDAASDGIVPPALFSGSIKLGEERVQISPRVINNDDSLLDIYLRKKAMDAQLQPVALRYDLSIDELYILLCFNNETETYAKQELSDFLNFSRLKTETALKRLKSQGYITWDEHSAEHNAATSLKLLDIHALPAAGPVLDSLKKAQETFRELCFSGFSEEETELYVQLSKKLNDNIVRSLT